MHPKAKPFEKIINDFVRTGSVRYEKHETSEEHKCGVVLAITKNLTLDITLVKPSQ